MRFVTFFLMLAGALLAQDYDVVVARGRVMDPASGLDAVVDVGIRGAKIAEISEVPLHGRMVVDAT